MPAILMVDLEYVSPLIKEWIRLPAGSRVTLEIVDNQTFIRGAETVEVFVGEYEILH